MNTISFQFFKSPVGEMILASFQGKLCICDWRYRKMRNFIDNRITKGLNASLKHEDSEIIQLAIEQLNEYFVKDRKQFKVPLLMVGTVFQKQVWNELMSIPFGQTESYLGLSKKLGDEKAIRAVASANGANAISIIVPCHRIIGSNGDLIGYAGGLPAKKQLLEIEGAIADKQMSLF